MEACWWHWPCPKHPWRKAGPSQTPMWPGLASHTGPHTVFRHHYWSKSGWLGHTSDRSPSQLKKHGMLLRNLRVKCWCYFMGPCFPFWSCAGPRVLALQCQPPWWPPVGPPAHGPCSWRGSWWNWWGTLSTGMQGWSKTIKSVWFDWVQCITLSTLLKKIKVLYILALPK